MKTLFIRPWIIGWTLNSRRCVSKTAFLCRSYVVFASGRPLRLPGSAAADSPGFAKRRRPHERDPRPQPTRACVLQWGVQHPGSGPLAEREPGRDTAGPGERVRGPENHSRSTLLPGRRQPGAERDGAGAIPAGKQVGVKSIFITFLYE